MVLAAGARLGPYEIVSALGAGGMGEVYRARDTRLDRIVAIKVILGRETASAAMRERFEREARAIALLSHANICTLHDIGHHEGTDFLVMEYLEGETLAARLSRQKVRSSPGRKSGQAPSPRSSITRRRCRWAGRDCESGPAARRDPPYCHPTRGRPHRRASRRHRAPGSETGQHHADARRREGARLRAGQTPSVARAGRD